MTLLKVAAIVGAGVIFAATPASAGVISVASLQLVKPDSQVEQIRYVNPGAIIGGVISGVLGGVVGGDCYFNDCGYDNGPYYGGGYGGRGRGGGFRGGGRGGGGVRVSHAVGGGHASSAGHGGRR
jgi:hypothetical protein